MSISETCGADSVRLYVLESGKEVPLSGTSLTILRPEPLFLELSDLSDDALFLYARDSDDASKKAAESSKSLISSSGATAKDKLAGLGQSYRSSVLAYRSEEAYSIVRAREAMKYVLPVPGAKMSREHTDIPGS